MESLVYGDVFEFSQKEYIFLAKSPEIIYAAEILNQENSGRLNSLLQRRIAQNTDGKLIESNTLYCFVMLTTEEFTKRCAFLANTGKDDFSMSITKLSVSLNEKDQKAIKQEIITSKAVPVELKKIIEANAV